LRPEARPELRELAPAVHGGAAPAGIIDFSTGISPLPAPPEILDAARNADLSRYPHPTALAYRQAAAELHGVTAEGIVAGAGSVELIWALARAFGGPGRIGLIVVPTFSEYEQALRASGARVVKVNMSPATLDVSANDLAPALGSHEVSVAFLCRPSNPCLSVMPVEELTRLAQRHPRTLFVVDEAYLPMFEGIEALPPAANVAVLRSMTKVFALPGLRLGHLVASPDVARAVQASLPPWNVSGAAQAAGVAAAQVLPRHGGAIRNALASLRRALATSLGEVVGPPFRTGGPFLLYRVDSADDVARRLLAAGVMVRSCSSFGLPGHIRVGTRLQADNECLAAAWRRDTRSSSAS